MFTQMSLPFTNIYNKFFSLRPKTCRKIVISLPSSKKEQFLKSFGTFLKICFILNLMDSNSNSKFQNLKTFHVYVQSNLSIHCLVIIVITIIIIIIISIIIDFMKITVAIIVIIITIILNIIIIIIATVIIITIIIFTINNKTVLNN